MTKKWQIYESNNEKIEEISQKYNLNKLLATILVNRKIEENQIEIYLNPKLVKRVFCLVLFRAA